MQKTVAAGLGACLLMLLLGLLGESCAALILMFVLAYFGIHWPFLVCFGVIFLASMVVGWLRGSSK